MTITRLAAPPSLRSDRHESLAAAVVHVQVRGMRPSSSGVEEAPSRNNVSAATRPAECTISSRTYKTCEIAGNKGVRIRKDRGEKITVSVPVVALEGRPGVNPRVGSKSWGWLGSGGFPQSTTTCAKSAFSEISLDSGAEDIVGTPSTASPGYFLFKPQPQLTTNGYIRWFTT